MAKVAEVEWLAAECVASVVGDGEIPREVATRGRVVVSVVGGELEECEVIPGGVQFGSGEHYSHPDGLVSLVGPGIADADGVPLLAVVMDVVEA